jgi:predicted RNase H-like HicB family nuclease
MNANFLRPSDSRPFAIGFLDAICENSNWTIRFHPFSSCIIMLDGCHKWFGGDTVFEITENASDMIKAYLKDREEIPSVRLLLVEGG